MPKQQMIISSDISLPFPRSLVFATYRDKLVELIPYMPNVRNIEVKSRWVEGNCVHCVNEWYGGGDIPPAARTLLSKDMLEWTEYNTWNESEFSLVWSIRTRAFTEAVHCAGKNRFFERNGITAIESRGELKIDPTQIKGVPSLLKKQVAAVAEDFLSKKIEPNLRQMSQGVQQYLEQAAVR